MKYGIDKIVAKISPESESLSGLGSIMKLKKISEELTRLVCTEMYLECVCILMYDFSRRKRIIKPPHKELHL